MRAPYLFSLSKPAKQQPHTNSPLPCHANHLWPNVVTTILERDGLRRKLLEETESPTRRWQWGQKYLAIHKKGQEWRLASFNLTLWAEDCCWATASSSCSTGAISSVPYLNWAMSGEGGESNVRKRKKKRNKKKEERRSHRPITNPRTLQHR